MPTAEQVERISRLAAIYGLNIPTEPVCRSHSSPGQILATRVYDRPDICFVHGPRGGGKSMGTGCGEHILSQIYPGFQSTILGGSQAQAQQIYDAIAHCEAKFQDLFPGHRVITTLNKQKAEYWNQSVTRILAASSKQVRGPHVHSFVGDEVDEMDLEILDAAYSMAMSMGGIKASVWLTSTWHRIAGPVAELRKRIPTKTFCAFDVLERCPEERSGPTLENCPACPLMKWCHSDRHLDPLNRPKAKRSRGHYTIDTLILQLNTKTEKSFESDLLSMEPRASGMWFDEFDDAIHVTEKADYDRNRPYHVSVDPGLHTGGVMFQTQKSWDGQEFKVNVFGDYYEEGLRYETNAHKIMAKAQQLTGLGICYARVSMDPASEQKDGGGLIARTEYARANCIGRNNALELWPFTGKGHPKSDALELIATLLMSAGKKVSLTIHPRCKMLIQAFKQYVRKKGTSGSWLDVPVDEQHPHEDLIDPLVGGVRLEIPEGRKKQPDLIRTHASSMT